MRGGVDRPGREGSREQEPDLLLATGASAGVAVASWTMVRARALVAERHCRRFFGDGNRGQHANHMQETLLLVRLGHADDGAEGMRGRIIVGLSGASGHDDRDALEALVRLDDETEIVAGHVRNFDFGDEQIRGALAEEFDGFGSCFNGFGNVAFADEDGANRIARAGVGFDHEDQRHRFFEVAGDIAGSRRFRREIGAFAFVEANANAETAFGHFEDAGNHGGAFVLHSTGGAGIRECDYDVHSAAVLGQFAGEEQAVARGVNGGADFGLLKRAGIETDADWRGKFRAQTAAALGRLFRYLWYFSIWSLFHCADDFGQVSHHPTSV